MSWYTVSSITPVIVLDMAFAFITLPRLLWTVITYPEIAAVFHLGEDCMPQKW